MNSSESLGGYREDFPSMRMRRNGKPPIYLDNACTTLVPKQVIDSLNEYYMEYPSCDGGRSRHWFADEVSSRIEGNFDLVLSNARPELPTRK